MEGEDKQKSQKDSETARKTVGRPGGQSPLLLAIIIFAKIAMMTIVINLPRDIPSVILSKKSNKWFEHNRSSVTCDFRACTQGALELFHSARSMEAIDGPYLSLTKPPSI